MPTDTTQRPTNPARTVGAVPAARGAADGARTRPSYRWEPPARVPVPGGPASPPAGRLAAVCGWAALLGFLGVAIAIRGQIAVLFSHTPAWYEPALMGIGLGGVALTVASFLSIRQRRTPWLLLALATGALIGSLVVTGLAT